jgi:hypothetical protein
VPEPIYQIHDVIEDVWALGAHTGLDYVGMAGEPDITEIVTLTRTHVIAIPLQAHVSLNSTA